MSEPIETPAPDSPPSAVAGTPPQEPVLLQYAVLAYLALLPVGHLAYLPLAGVYTTLTDGLLGIVLLIGLAELLRGRLGPDASLPDPGRPVTAVQGVLLLLFAAWVAASALWGYHTSYALLKGLGFAALALGVVAIGESRLNWRTAVDAWLAGTALTILVTWIPALLGPEVLRERVIYLGGMVDGLPFPRVRGPMLHPNMFGDYLVVSAALCWTRWGEWRRRAPVGTLVFAGALIGTIVMTVSSAWVGAGVLMFFIGLLHTRRRDGSPSTHFKRPVPALLILGGVALTAVSSASLLAQMDFHLGAFSVSTGGIRPEIWSSAMGALREAPLIGVGAAPYLGAAPADPFVPAGALSLWDAHNTYISILGQFGGIGAILFFLPIVLIVYELLRGGVSSVRIGIMVAVFAVALHGVFQASEELRHFWALLGIAVLVAHREAMVGFGRAGAGR